MITPLQVWVRSLGSIATKIQVRGADDAVWLREKLSNNGVECTEPVDHPGGAFVSFRALIVNGIDHAKVMNLIQQLPEVELMFDPA